MDKILCSSTQVLGGRMEGASVMLVVKPSEEMQSIKTYQTLSKWLLMRLKQHHRVIYLFVNTTKTTGNEIKFY